MVLVLVLGGASVVFSCGAVFFVVVLIFIFLLMLLMVFVFLSNCSRGGFGDLCAASLRLRLERFRQLQGVCLVRHLVGFAIRIFVLTSTLSSGLFVALGLNYCGR